MKLKNFLKISIFALLLSIGIANTTFADDTTPICTAPKILVNNVCTDPAPTCIPPQTLVNNVCTDPAPAPAPVLTVNLTIRDGGLIIFSGPVTIQAGDSVLTTLNNEDSLNPNFSVSEVKQYSFGSYLNCITDSIGNECANWQYTVDGSYPFDSIDQKKLNGGENIYFYFGPQYQINLSSNSITTSDTLTVTAQKYNYQNNSWGTRTGVTVGLTQPDPNNPWSPAEIQTKTVDGNGQATFTGIKEGTYNVGIKEDYYYPTTTLTVNPTPVKIEQVVRSGGMIGGNNQTKIPEIKNSFDLTKATNFLISQQKENGSFGEELYTDWTAIALASNPATPKTALAKITKYFSTNKFSGENLTDHERHTMALMALNLNPYNFKNENYIEKIVSKFDGTQFGDKNADNDDIFALIVLQNAGYQTDDKIISSDLKFILSQQKTDGSWDESVDLTGAAIEALSNFSSTTDSLKKAENYLKQNQKDNSSFENVSSTAWAMQGILALGEKTESWTKNNNAIEDYLALNQANDGGIKEENLNNKIWQTAYVITSLSGKTWNQIMQKFTEPTTKTEVVITTLKTNPLQETISNSNQAKFAKELQKFQKPTETKTEIKINENNSNQNTTEPVKKEGFFRSLWRKIFGF